jgi:hypothetical protein
MKINYTKDDTRESTGGLKVFDLKKTNEGKNEIEKYVKQSKRIGNFSEVFKIAIGALHASPRLYASAEKIVTGNLSVYFGITKKKRVFEKHFVMILGIIQTLMLQGWRLQQ